MENDFLSISLGRKEMIHPLELKKLETLFRHKVFYMLIARGKVPREIFPMPSTWQHAGKAGPS
jgi:hypothetical protein